MKGLNRLIIGIVSLAGSAASQQCGEADEFGLGALAILNANDGSKDGFNAGGSDPDPAGCECPDGTAELTNLDDGVCAATANSETGAILYYDLIGTIAHTPAGAPSANTWGDGNTNVFTVGGWADGAADHLRACGPNKELQHSNISGLCDVAGAGSGTFNNDDSVWLPSCMEENGTVVKYNGSSNETGEGVELDAYFVGPTANACACGMSKASAGESGLCLDDDGEASTIGAGTIAEVVVRAAGGGNGAEDAGDRWYASCTFANGTAGDAGNIPSALTAHCACGSQVIQAGAVGICIPGPVTDDYAVVADDMSGTAGSADDVWVPYCVGVDNSTNGFKDELTPMCFCGAPNLAASYKAQETVGHCSEQTVGGSAGTWTVTTNGVDDVADLPDNCETDGSRNSQLCKCNSKYYRAQAGFCSTDNDAFTPTDDCTSTTDPGTFHPYGHSPACACGNTLVDGTAAGYCLDAATDEWTAAGTISGDVTIQVTTAGSDCSTSADWSGDFSKSACVAIKTAIEGALCTTLDAEFSSGELDCPGAVSSVVTVAAARRLTEDRRKLSGGNYILTVAWTVALQAADVTTFTSETKAGWTAAKFTTEFDSVIGAPSSLTVDSNGKYGIISAVSVGPEEEPDTTTTKNNNSTLRSGATGTIVAFLVAAVVMG